MNKPILLFDGVCNLCDTSVHFIIDRNPKKNLLFASLQSDKGQELLNKFNLSTENFDSMVLVVGDKYYTKSSAALKVSQSMSLPWSALSIFIIIPKIIRDSAYSVIARNRYKWFGKQELCRVPTPELRERFLG